MKGPAPLVQARLVPLDPGLYRFSLTGMGNRAVAGPLGLPAVQVCAMPPDPAAILVFDAAGAGRSWLGQRCGMLFVAAPLAGAAALLTAYCSDDNLAPLDLEIRPVAAEAPAGRVIRFGPNAAAEIAIEAVADIRGRGPVRFADPTRIGHLGQGLWIEAVTILTSDPAIVLEYKGLSADGSETPWIACGSRCGSADSGMPLIGFALRQKAAVGAAVVDCEYAGAFASGAAAGPARNGAPCRSPTAGDPLEGLRLRVAPRLE